MNLFVLLSSQPALQEELEAGLATSREFSGVTLLRFETVEDIQAASDSVGEIRALFVDLETEGVSALDTNIPMLAIHTSESMDMEVPSLQRPIRSTELVSILRLVLNSTEDAGGGLALARDRALMRFHSGIAHDINNRLATLTGYLSMMPDIVEGEEEMIQDMEDATDGIAVLIRRLQVFKDRDLMPPRSLDLLPVLSSIRDLSSRLVHEDSDIQFELPGDSAVEILGDEASVEFLLVSTLSWYSHLPDTIRVLLAPGPETVDFTIRGTHTVTDLFLQEEDWEKDTLIRDRIMTELGITMTCTRNAITFSFQPA